MKIRNLPSVPKKHSVEKNKSLESHSYFLRDMLFFQLFVFQQGLLSTVLQKYGYIVYLVPNPPKMCCRIMNLKQFHVVFHDLKPQKSYLLLVWRHFCLSETMSKLYLSFLEPQKSEITFTNIGYIVSFY